MQPTTKELPHTDVLTTLPMAQAGSLLPVALAFVEALFLARPPLQGADPGLERALRRAATGVAHALVSARMASGRASAWRHLRRASGHATEAHRLLRDAQARRLFVTWPGGGRALLALATRLMSRLAPPA